MLVSFQIFPEQTESIDFFFDGQRVVYLGGELPSGAPKEEFGGWFLRKLPWGTALKFSQRHRQLLVKVRRGAGTREDPCKLDRSCSSASL